MWNAIWYKQTHIAQQMVIFSYGMPLSHDAHGIIFHGPHSQPVYRTHMAPAMHRLSFYPLVAGRKLKITQNILSSKNKQNQNHSVGVV